MTSERALWHIACAVVGFAVGGVLFSLHSEPPKPVAPPPVVETVTVTRDVPGPTVTRLSVPAECAAAVEAATAAQRAITDYEKYVGALPDLIDDAGVALTSGNHARLNELREKQIKLEADSIQSLIDMRSAQDQLESEVPKCKSALKKG